MQRPKPAPENGQPTAQILGMDGNPYRPSQKPEQAQPNPNYSGGAGGGDDMTKRITLEQNVKGLNIAVGLLIAAFGAAFLFFLSRIDDRFDRVDEPLRAVQMSIAGQTEALKAIDTRMAAIERNMEKPNDNSKGSGGAK